MLFQRHLDGYIYLTLHELFYQEYNKPYLEAQLLLHPRTVKWPKEGLRCLRLSSRSSS